MGVQFKFHAFFRRARRHGSSALGSERMQEGESPSLMRALASVAESNCVVERRGGEQLEAKE